MGLSVTLGLWVYLLTGERGGGSLALSCEEGGIRAGEDEELMRSEGGKSGECGGMRETHEGQR